MIDPQALWARFIDAFVSELNSLDAVKLADIWSTQEKRTLHYCESVLPAIGRRLGGLEVERELLRVDFALRTPDAHVPHVFVESENITSSAHTEIRNLCCTHAPLRVLITVCEWDSDWPSGGFRNRHLQTWRDIYLRHANEGGIHGILGVLVTEWKPTGIFQISAVEFGEIACKETVVLQRRLPPGLQPGSTQPEPPLSA